MQYFGLPGNAFLVYEFLKSELNEDYFTLLKNKDLYERYKAKINISTVKKKTLTYRVFINAIRFLEKFNLIKIVKLKETNNYKYTVLIPANYKYRYVGVVLDIVDNKVKLVAKVPQGFEITLYCPNPDDLQLFTEDINISFFAEYVGLSGKKLNTQNPKKILLMR